MAHDPVLRAPARIGIVAPMSRPVTWGLVSTIKAPSRDILNFAAHHLDLGAHVLHIYLDDDAPEARAALNAHPRCRVIVTDEGYWRGRRPEAHQPRQTRNATRAYRRNPGVDWLGHIDVDEFLWPLTPLGQQLASLPDDAMTARIRPIEALAPCGPDSDGYFKACATLAWMRRDESEAIYPNFGAHLNGGFLSHVSGKIFVRCGADNLSLRIHNAFVDGTQIPNVHHLDETHLCHLHAPSWSHWQHAYRYRLRAGSYRPSLKGAGVANLNMNALFSMIEAEGGEDALRAFYDEVCTASPGLLDRLRAHGLLHRFDLDLEAKRARHFPDHA